MLDVLAMQPSVQPLISPMRILAPRMPPNVATPLRDSAASAVSTCSQCLRHAAVVDVAESELRTRDAVDAAGSWAVDSAVGAAAG